MPDLVIPPPASGYELRVISDIKVGERHRRDLGDLEALAHSIAAIGLLHPITIEANGNLLTGVRRLAACKLLGWTNGFGEGGAKMKKDPNILNQLPLPLRLQIEENALRKPLTQPELAIQQRCLRSRTAQAHRARHPHRPR